MKIECDVRNVVFSSHVRVRWRERKEKSICILHWHRNVQIFLRHISTTEKLLNLAISLALSFSLHFSGSLLNFLI